MRFSFVNSLIVKGVVVDAVDDGHRHRFVISERKKKTFETFPILIKSVFLTFLWNSFVLVKLNSKWNLQNRKEEKAS